MSILIKGVEMPKSCDKCIYAGWSNFFQIYVCEAIKKEEPVLFNGKQVKSTDIARSGRADNCPLIEVPEPHGRLGDLDRLEQMFADIDDAPYSGFDGTEPFYSAEDAAQIIGLAPTVIPASKGE